MALVCALAFVTAASAALAGSLPPRVLRSQMGAGFPSFELGFLFR